MDKITGFKLHRKIEFSKKTIISLVISLVYAVLLIILVAHHEPFCDEINVYMSIRNFDFISSFDNIAKNPNSLTFYAMMFPLAKSGVSFSVIQVLCALFSVPAVFIINRFSPLGTFVNLIITFSAPMMYFFPVIARPYCMIPAVLIAGCFAYSKTKVNTELRKAYCIVAAVLVFAVSQIHIIMFGFATSLFFLFLYEIKTSGRKILNSEKVSVTVMTLSLCAVMAQAFIALKSNYLFSYDSVISAKRIMYSFFSCFFDPSQAGYNVGILPLDCPTAQLLAVISAVLLVVTTAYLFLVRIRYGLAFLLSVLFPLYIYLNSYPVIMANRVYMIHFVFLFFLWLAVSEKGLSENIIRTGKILTAVLFALTIPSGIIFARTDYSGYFSAGRNMAEFIGHNIPDDGKTMIFAEQPWQGLPVAYYLKNRPIYNIDGHRLIRIENYLPQNNIREITQDKDFMFVIVSSNHIDTRKMLESEGFHLMYTTPPAIMPDEAYSLYAVRL